MKYKNIDHSKINLKNTDRVSIIEKGDYIEQRYMSKRNYKANTIKISKEQYMLKATGEVLDFKTKSSTKNENINSVRKTMKRILDLLQSNIRTDNYLKILFVTKTYTENQRDPEEIYKDFRNFYKKLCRYAQKYNLCDKGNSPKYICIIEPQERGAFHYHAFLFFDKEKPYIKNEDMMKMWGNNGWCFTKAINDPLGMPSYLLAYLTDLEISEEKVKYFKKSDIKEVDVNGVKKSIIKGGRLYLYPSHLKILRHSRGLRMPIKMEMNYENAKEYVRDKFIVFERTFELENDNYKTLVNIRVYR